MSGFARQVQRGRRRGGSWRTLIGKTQLLSQDSLTVTCPFFFKEKWKKFATGTGDGKLEGVQGPHQSLAVRGQRNFP